LALVALPPVSNPKYITSSEASRDPPFPPAEDYLLFNQYLSVFILSKYPNLKQSIVLCGDSFNKCHKNRMHFFSQMYPKAAQYLSHGNLDCCFLRQVTMVVNSVGSGENLPGPESQLYILLVK
jgi:hypothetical protein